MEYSVRLLEIHLALMRKNTKREALNFLVPTDNGMELSSDVFKATINDLREAINILLYGTPKWYHRKHRLNVLRKHYGAQPYKTS